MIWRFSDGNWRNEGDWMWSNNRQLNECEKGSDKGIEKCRDKKEQLFWSVKLWQYKSANEMGMVRGKGKWAFCMTADSRWCIHYATRKWLCTQATDLGCGVGRKCNPDVIVQATLGLGPWSGPLEMHQPGCSIAVIGSRCWNRNKIPGCNLQG
jgi:hypothetical protein